MSQKRQYFLAIPFFYKKNKKNKPFICRFTEIWSFSLCQTLGAPCWANCHLKYLCWRRLLSPSEFCQALVCRVTFFKTVPTTCTLFAFAAALSAQWFYGQCRFLFPTVEGSDFFSGFCSFLTLWWLAGLHVCCKSFYELKKDSIFQPNSVQPSCLDTDKT